MSLLVGPWSLSPRNAQKIERVPVDKEADCTLFENFKPMAGGQTDFWRLVPFDKIADIEPRWVWFRGGIGAGKSMTGAAFICTRAKLDPEGRGLITANSYPQLTTSTLIALVEFCDRFGVPLSPRSSTTEETAKSIARARLCRIFDASILVISAEAFAGTTANAKETGRGLQVRYVWADEYAYAPKSVFDTINGRLGRGKGLGRGLGLITSSINRNAPYNFAYKKFVDPKRSDETKRLFVSINASTKDNTSLDADYVPSLEASYTPEMVALELRGIFVASTDGKAFNHFCRDRNVRHYPYDGSRPVHISFDFNRSPATCIIAQQLTPQHLHVLQEFYLLNSDTFALAKKVVASLKELKPFMTYVYGDATGKAKTANSQQSNWDIVYKELKGLSYSSRVPTVNPPIIDTVNTTNSLLYHGHLTIDEHCEELIIDLETVELDGKGGLDKSDVMRCQVVDDLRYLCHALMPITKAASASIPVGSPLANPFKR